MADEITTTTQTSQAAGGSTQPPAEPSWLPERLERAREQERAKYADYDALKAKAAEYDKAQEAAKSDLQLLTERAERAERERDDARLGAERASVAAAKGVPASALTGTTREQMEQQADELLGWRGQAAASNTLNPRGGFYSGASGAESAPTDPKARAAAALRALGRP